MELPGIKAGKETVHRTVLLTDKGALYFPQGKLIDGEKSRDPLNTGDTDVLRPGVLLGKTGDEKYAPSIFGLLAADYNGTDTEIEVAPETAAEILRRLGSAGGLYLTGPAESTGTVRMLLLAYSDVDVDTGIITITKVGAKATFTLTEAAGTDVGTFRIRVTSPSGASARTGVLAFDVTAANMEIALEALANVGTDNVAVTGNAGGPYTVAFIEALGNMKLTIENDGTNDDVIWEGGIVVAQTVVGVDGRCIAGAFVQPTDASESPTAVIGDGYGVKVTDERGDIDAQIKDLLVGGVLNVSRIVNYPDAAETTLVAWLRGKLNEHGCFMFSDEF